MERNILASSLLLLIAPACSGLNIISRSPEAAAVIGGGGGVGGSDGDGVGGIGGDYGGGGGGYDDPVQRRVMVKEGANVSLACGEREDR